MLFVILVVMDLQLQLAPGVLGSIIICGQMALLALLLMDYVQEPMNV